MMKTTGKQTALLCALITSAATFCAGAASRDASDAYAESLLRKMTLEEKIGQLNQIHYGEGKKLEENAEKGLVGSVMSITDPEEFNRIQRIAVEKSRLGIPLINARDVIHGFKTIFPIPLGQACSFDTELIEQCARIAAVEASAAGIRWTFGPMVDISQDPRWGRIAEGFGEDPFLVSTAGAAMVRGFQGKSLSDPSSIAACAKHFAGYGASESGKDYNSTFISPNRMHNLYLRPFHSCVDAGAATIMTSFNDNDGVPSTANKWLIDDVLRNEWGFKGVVISDWEAINEMINHGYCENPRAAASESLKAGVDIDMMSRAYINHLKDLVASGEISEAQIDKAVLRVLRLKHMLGLFDSPYCDENLTASAFYAPRHLDKAQELAEKSIVLLKNDKKTLPLGKNIRKILVTGPLADAPHEQLGTWIFDGEADHSVTPLKAIIDKFGKENVTYVPALKYSRDKNIADLDLLKRIAADADAVIAFVGEESILSGEAHSLASLNLQGAQSRLIEELSKTGKPLIIIVMAGRPLTIGNEITRSDALLYAFAPGTMGGPAIANTLTGENNPSGKLPVTFPAAVGQIPVYYNHNNTGRPATGRELMIDSIPVGSGQTSLGNKSYYLDYPQPLYSFGYGLSYSDFKYSDLKCDKAGYREQDSVKVTFNVENTSDIPGTEIVQVYYRDVHARSTRPVKELVYFERIPLNASEKKLVSLTIPVEKMKYRIGDKFTVEPGDMELYVGGNSRDCLKTTFTITD